jgi:radical SAM superfamily enzyme YgiQ (UPF0313 family)
MLASFVCFISRMENPLMAYASGISYLEKQGINVHISPFVVWQDRKDNENERSVHQNITGYTEEYIFGKTVDDIVDLPAVLKLLRNYDNNFDILKDINIPQYRMPLIAKLDDYAYKLKDSDVIFFSVFRYHFLYHLILAFKIKRLSPNTKIVFGGPQIILSKLSRLVLDKANFINHIICGDIESGLFDYFSDNITSKIHYSKDVVMNELNMPKYDLNVSRAYGNQIMMHTSRNCFNKCAYCPSVYLKYRKIDLDIFEDWIKYYCSKGVKSIYFTDAILNPSPNRFNKLLDILLKYGNKQSYYMWCHSMGLDEEQIKMISKLSFKDPGGFVVAYDLVSNELRDKFKRPTSENIDLIIEWLAKYKIKTMLPFIVGTPLETEVDFNLILEKINFIKSFSSQFGVNPVFFSYLFIPGSPIFENPQKFGIIYDYWDENTANIYPPLYDVVINSPRYYNGVNIRDFERRLILLKGNLSRNPYKDYA